jgi:hypothetical protein
MKIGMVSNEKRSSEKRSKKSDNPALGSRERYLLERDRIKNEIGGLDQIRESLGLSQRRACQLLLVDPSAWTRWNKSEAPPHIYQALRWLVQLKKVNPSVVGPSDLSTRIDFVQSSTQSKISQLEQNLSMLERALSIHPQHAQALAGVEGIGQALNNQRERFERRVLALEAKINDLVAQKVRRPSKAKRLRKRKLKKKVQRKTKTQSKRPSKTRKRRLKKHMRKTR